MRTVSRPSCSAATSRRGTGSSSTNGVSGLVGVLVIRTPSAAVPDCPSEALDVGGEHDNRHEPPGGGAGLHQPPRREQPEGDQGCDGPVVADYVVDEEQYDRLSPSPHDHHAAPASDATSACLRTPTPRRQPDTVRMSSSAAATYRAPSHTSAKSPPGHSTLRPSPAQNVPKVTSIAPTKSCSARLGIAATYR